jgi:outer membrane lipoprotein carrier protein
MACFLVLTFSVGISSAETDKATLKKLVHALEDPFKAGKKSGPQISDFSFSFLQDSEIASLNQHQEARGLAQFKFLPATDGSRVSPLFRWEYREPDYQLMVSDGRQIWFYIPENQQVIRSEAQEVVTSDHGNNPLIFLTNLGELSRFFEIRWFREEPERGDLYFLEIIPLGKSPWIKTIVLGVPKTLISGPKDRPFFPIRSLVLTNISNDRTRVEITGTKVNQNPADAIFQFTPPPGTEILTPEDMQGAF